MHPPARRGKGPDYKASQRVARPGLSWHSPGVERALVFADSVSADATARTVGAARVLAGAVDVLDLGATVAEDAAPTLARLAQEGGYAYILAPATARGRDVLPRAAALLSAPYIPGVQGVEGAGTFTRSAHAGAVVEVVRCTPRPVVLTVRPHAFAPAQADETKTEHPDPSSLCEVVGQAQGEGPDLATSRVVVAGGQALGSAETFAGLVGGLADALSGAAGATRDAVEAGYAPNACQVGQTGVSVAPDLYIGLGVSGAVQHTCGMREARCVVAVNTDAGAPMCQIADYVLEADLFDAAPRLIAALRASG
jgi:electron transfer flavoprotein alpha subunit